MQNALRAGLQTVKLLPADRLGGLEMVRALAGTFPATGVAPSGGVSPQNAGDHQRHLSFPAVSGSWMATGEFLCGCDYEAIALADTASRR